MNVTFRLPTEELEARMIKEGAEAGFGGLKGHRNAGGLRASIYNAVSVADVEAFVSFLDDFRSRLG